MFLRFGFGSESLGEFRRSGQALGTQGVPFFLFLERFACFDLGMLCRAVRAGVDGCYWILVCEFTRERYPPVVGELFVNNEHML